MLKEGGLPKGNRKEKDVGYLHVSVTITLFSQLIDVSYFTEMDTFL